MNEEQSWHPEGHDVPRWVPVAAVLALAILLALVVVAVRAPRPDDTITGTMVLTDGVLSSVTMPDKEYVSLSVEPAAREALRLLQIRLAAAVQRPVTLSDAIVVACRVTTYAEVSGGGAFDHLHTVAEELRVAKTGGCE
jgi:hypothetical protein